MDNPFSPLLEPGRIGSLVLRNRIIMAPMGSNFAEADGHCGERIQAYYEARAKGGAGLLIMGVCAVAFPHGTAEPYQVGVSHDDFIPGLAGIAERVIAMAQKSRCSCSMPAKRLPVIWPPAGRYGFPPCRRHQNPIFWAH